MSNTIVCTNIFNHCLFFMYMKNKRIGKVPFIGVFFLHDEKKRISIRINNTNK
jgi:hypothetical protein